MCVVDRYSKHIVDTGFLGELKAIPDNPRLIVSSYIFPDPNRERQRDKAEGKKVRRTRESSEREGEESQRQDTCKK